LCRGRAAASAYPERTARGKFVSDSIVVVWR
jgi:hypothetical protein